jgi:uncharacterized protein (TIRG00374 family)
MDWGALRNTLAGANYWWLLPFLALEVVVIWTRALRWRLMLEDRLSTARLFWITNIGYLLNNVLPLRLGEVGRVYLVTRRSTVGAMQGLSSVVVERLVDVLCLIALIFLLLPLVPGSVAFVATGMTLSGVAMAGIALIFVAAHMHTIVEAGFTRLLSRVRPQLAQALQQHLHDFLASVRVIQGRRLWLCLMWSVITWTVSVASMYVLMLAFDPQPKWFIGMLANCAIALGVALPSAPAGLGLWEAATVAALTMAEVPAEMALAFAILSHLASFISLAVLGIAGLVLEGKSFGELARSVRDFMPTPKQ